jgi:hypothetical protein
MSRKNNVFSKVMKIIGVSSPSVKTLQDEEFDFSSIQSIPNKDMIKEMKTMRIPARDSIVLKRWNELMRKTNTRNTTRRRKPRLGTNNHLNALSNANAYANANEFLNAPPNPILYREASVSEDLLDELIHNNPLRVYMDELMNSIQDLDYLGERVQLTEYGLSYEDPVEGTQVTTHMSRLGNATKSLYYNWFIEKDGEMVPAFHLSLHHSKEAPYNNRTSFQRQEIGAFHVRMNNAHRTLRRILINLVQGVYVISICKGKRTGYIDPVADRIGSLLVDYYTNTGRRAMRRNHC